MGAITTDAKTPILGGGRKMTNTYTTMRQANAARQLEWDPSNVITLSFRGNELAGEVGEACNVIKKLERERLGLPGTRDNIEHLAEELADAVLCADLIAMSMGIDLDAAIEAKFNATSEKYGLTTKYKRSATSGHTSVDHMRMALYVFSQWALEVANTATLTKLEQDMYKAGITLEDIGRWSNIPNTERKST